MAEGAMIRGCDVGVRGLLASAAQTSPRDCRLPGAGIAQRRMAVRRDLRSGKSDRLCAAQFALMNLIRRRSHVYRDAALQVRQGESALSVTAISCAYQGEQHIIFRDGE